MPREDGWRQAGKPRDRYRTEAPPQRPSRQLQARLDAYNSEGLYKGQSHPKSDQGYHKPGSQNPRK